MDLWRHPLDTGGSMGASKKKHERKARILRRMDKRQAKHNRQFRRDPDNFVNGSNAVVTSSTPFIKITNPAIRL